MSNKFFPINFTQHKTLQLPKITGKKGKHISLFFFFAPDFSRMIHLGQGETGLKGCPEIQIGNLRRKQSLCNVLIVSTKGILMIKLEVIL